MTMLQLPLLRSRYRKAWGRPGKPNCCQSAYELSGLAQVLLGLLIVLATQLSVLAQEEKPKLSAGLIAASDASPARLKELKLKGMNTVIFTLDSLDDESKKAVSLATTAAKEVGLSVGYWVEVARSPELADKHPDWMASLQTHDEWRRFFPDTPKPKANEVAKTYPWVPILSREPFNAQRERVVALLADLPTSELIFLNDLQGAPSACGCGNPLCRWTSDYGERRTTIPLGDDAAALFIHAIRKVSPGSEVIPVWATECEEHDGHPDGLCAGVGCFNGICWKAYTRQLMPVAATNNRIAVLATYKQFQRDVARYPEASWVHFALKTFGTVPPKHGGKAIDVSRMIAVVQGWDVSTKEIAAQQMAAKKAGAHGCVVAFDKIEQSWSPKVIPWK